MAAPAVPAGAGLGAYIVVGASLLLLWLFLMGAKEGYDYSLGALLRTLARAVQDIWLIGGTLADILERLDHLVLNAIGLGLGEVESAMTKYWLGLGWLAHFTWDTLAEFADDVRDTVAALVSSAIPTAIELGTAPTRINVGRLRRELRHTVDEELARFRRGIDSLQRDLGAERLRAMRGIDALRLDLRAQLRALEHRVSLRIGQAVGALSRPVAARLGLLEYLLGASILGAAGIAALTRVFPYWQCTNVRRFNRGLCRVPIRSLGAWLDLLSLGAEAFLVTELCDFVAALSGAAELARPWLLEFVALENALIGCNGASAPPELPLAELGIPPASSSIALAA